jgi:catechol 2,3-dioxygenase-like lactoylglutathione lyase family enzyme
MDRDDTATTDEIAERLRAAVTAREPGILEPHLAEDARWESCVGRNQVIEYMERAAGLDLEIEDVSAYRDRIVLTLRIADRDDLLYQVVFVRDGEIVEFRAVADADEATTAAPSEPPPPAPDLAPSVTGMATILPVRDLQAALDHYRALGFRVSPYDDGYGYAVRGTADLHLALRPGLDPRQNASAVYLYVNDAEALFAEWRAAGVQGQFFEPHDTEYGLREGAHIDRDGNLLKFGSRLQE